jgi:hypothetical protein
MWLLLIVILNLQANPPQIHHGEVIGTYGSSKDCIEAHSQYLEIHQPIPPELNLGCVALNNTKRI